MPLTCITKANKNINSTVIKIKRLTNNESKWNIKKRIDTSVPFKKQEKTTWSVADLEKFGFQVWEGCFTDLFGLHST